MYKLSIIKNHWGWSFKGIYDWITKSWGLPFEKKKLHCGIKNLYVYRIGPFQLSETTIPFISYQVVSEKNGLLSKQKNLMGCISWINEYINRPDYTNEDFFIEEIYFDEYGKLVESKEIKYFPPEK